MLSLARKADPGVSSLSSYIIPFYGYGKLTILYYNFLFVSFSSASSMEGRLDLIYCCSFCIQPTSGSSALRCVLGN